MMTIEDIEKRLSSFPGEWNNLLIEEKDKDYFKSLVSAVAKKYQNETVYPPLNDVYRALELVQPDKVKVVIIGQDPYINKGQANGLAFSVGDGVKIPPSLLNIYKELNIEYGYDIPKVGSLEKWAKQGVLLLNASLTVKEGEAMSHSKLGWDKLTDSIIRKVDEINDGVVYILWGNFALKKKTLISNETSKIIECAHPSPLSASRGFFNSGCFKKCNEYLKESGKEEIDFQIKDDRLISLF